MLRSSEFSEFSTRSQCSISDTKQNRFEFSVFKERANWLSALYFCAPQLRPNHAVALPTPRATPYDRLTMFDRGADYAAPITPPLSSKWSVIAGMMCRRWYRREAIISARSTNRTTLTPPSLF
jgi:hypothetical protein